MRQPLAGSGIFPIAQHALLIKLHIAILFNLPAPGTKPSHSGSITPKILFWKGGEKFQYFSSYFLCMGF